MCVCINRKQAALWSLGDNQHSQKAKQEERAMPHLITSMEELTLNPTHINTNPNGNLSRSQSSDQLHEVGHTHRTGTLKKLCVCDLKLSLPSNFSIHNHNQNTLCDLYQKKSLVSSLCFLSHYNISKKWIFCEVIQQTPKILHN